MSTVTVDTWMPFYVADYLADTGHLSTAEHGAYMLLLMQAWKNGGALPIESDRLRRITRMEPKAWRESESVVLEFFYVHEHREIRHHRIDTELQRAMHLVNQRKEAGKASAAKRKAQRQEQREGNDRSTGDATEGATNGAANEQQTGRPSPSPSPKPLGNVVDDSAVVSADDDERPRHPAKGDPFPMTLEWQPSQHFPEICRQAGMAGAEEDQAAIAEFRTYWLSRDAAATQHEWDHKLLTNLQRVRIRAKADAAAAKANDAAPKAPSRDAGRMAASTTSLEAALSGGTRNRNGGHDGRVIEANAATRMD